MRGLALVALAACSRASSTSPPAGSSAPAVSTSSGGAPTGGPAALPVAIDAVTPGATDACTFGHRGVLVDLGDPKARARLAPTERDGRVESVEREGASWARVLARGVAIPFVATADDAAAATADGATPVIEARVRGGSARSIQVYLNGKAAGTWPLVKGETQVVSVKLPIDPPSADPTRGPTAPQLVAGNNDLLLRFRGAARGGASAQDVQAEIDWVHVGGALEGETYAAPTRTETTGSVTLGSVPMRAVALRAPGYERCLGWLPASSRLVGSVGASGAGDADVELRAVRDRAPPVVLAAMHLVGNAPWKAFDLPLDRATSPVNGGKGTLGAIELVAVRGARGVRVAFGEPRVVTPAPPPPSSMPRARAAVIVVMGDIAPRSIAPYGGPAAMPELAALAKDGVTFEANRATSGAASGAFASILTALPARAHGVTDDEAGLGADVTTLADLTRQAGIRAALFTANPTTGAAFGFGRAWDTFAEHPPDLGEPTGAGFAPFDDAARWIADHGGDKDDGGRFLVVVHARGGHPPWDVSPEALKALAPPDYTGSIDPHRAAELLSHVRGNTARAPTMRLTDADRARAWALYTHSLESHDAALGRVLAALKATGRDRDTLVVVTGDTGLGEARAPLEDSDSLDETSLSTPLVVRFPRAEGDDAAPFAGKRVPAPTTGADVARTVVASFGLPPPAAFLDSAADLAQVASGTVDPRGRPELAVDGTHLALAWGSFVLRATAPDSIDAAIDVTKLCDRSLEPACTSDVRGAFPLALSAARRELAARATAVHAPVPVVEPPALRASLKLWGL